MWCNKWTSEGDDFLQRELIYRKEKTFFYRKYNVKYLLLVWGIKQNVDGIVENSRRLYLRNKWLQSRLLLSLLYLCPMLINTENRSFLIQISSSSSSSITWVHNFSQAKEISGKLSIRRDWNTTFQNKRIAVGQQETLVYSQLVIFHPVSFVFFLKSSKIKKMFVGHDIRMYCEKTRQSAAVS